MATGNSVHDEVKEQQQKLKGKPFKEKWAYFWEYYKIQTLVAIAVLALQNLIYTFCDAQGYRHGSSLCQLLHEYRDRLRHDDRRF